MKTLVNVLKHFIYGQKYARQLNAKTPGKTPKRSENGLKRRGRFVVSSIDRSGFDRSGRLPSRSSLACTAFDCMMYMQGLWWIEGSQGASGWCAWARTTRSAGAQHILIYMIYILNAHTHYHKCLWCLLVEPFDRVQYNRSIHATHDGNASMVCSICTCP